MLIFPTTACRNKCNTPFSFNNSFNCFKNVLLLRETRLHFSQNLLRKISTFSRKVHIFLNTAYRKKLITSFTSNAALNFLKKVLYFERNACEFLTKASKEGKYTFKVSAYLPTKAYKKNWNSHFTSNNALNVLKKVFLFSEVCMCISHECFL